VGSDGANPWLGSIKADLSPIPSGSTLNTATLDLTGAGCMNTGACASDSLNIGSTTADVASANTGADLAALNAPSDGIVASETSGLTAIDVTALVQGWYATGSGGNFGAIISATDEATTTQGMRFAGPQASSGAATLLITFTPPTAPTAPQAVTVLPGDGSVLVTWAEPAVAGYVDTTGDTDGVTQYSVSVATTSGTVVQSVTTSDIKAAISGLTDGSSYTAAVSALNPVGTGPTASSSIFIPVAVPGGPALYSQSVSQLLNAQDQLETGTVRSTQDATSALSAHATVAPALGSMATVYEASFVNLAVNSQQDTADQTVLSNTVVALSSDGSTVAVYTTATDSYTTVDTSSGAAVNVPGTTVDDMAYLFKATSTAPSILDWAEEDALVMPITENLEDTATSPTLQGRNSNPARRYPVPSRNRPNHGSIHRCPADG
jgi:hypothetical protein